MGKKYKVICSAVNGKQKIYKAGDVVNENDFIDGHAGKYVESGHLELIPVKEFPTKSKKKETK